VLRLLAAAACCWRLPVFTFGSFRKSFGGDFAIVKFYFQEL
jgi:hypothetical protein